MCTYVCMYVCMYVKASITCVLCDDAKSTESWSIKDYGKYL